MSATADRSARFNSRSLRVGNLTGELRKSTGLFAHGEQLRPNAGSTGASAVGYSDTVTDILRGLIQRRARARFVTVPLAIRSARAPAFRSRAAFRARA